MIPGGAAYNEWYSVPNQLQALDAVGYESTDLQAGLVCAFEDTQNCPAAGYLIEVYLLTAWKLDCANIACTVLRSSQRKL
jgi:hypothetical protein